MFFFIKSKMALFDDTYLYIYICRVGHQSSMRLCMGSRRGFIIRMRIGNMPVDPMSTSHTVRARQQNTLGPSSDGQQYAVVHVTGWDALGGV